MYHENEWNQEETLRYHEIQIGELQQKRDEYLFTRYKFQHPTFSSPALQPIDYLLSVEPYVTTELISQKNYAQIKQLADQFTGGITSFFGFESRLNSPDARSDYLFAVSARRGEREALASLFQNGSLPEAFFQQPEWQQVRKLALTWADPHSILYNNVLGLWFEFDTAESSPETPVPCIFIAAVPLRINTPEDIQKCIWLTQTALPLLTGQTLSETLEQRVLQAIQQLPEGASLMNVGAMIARSTNGVRLVITRILPTQVLAYLTSIGWTDKNEGLPLLLEELTQQVSRIVLHINITEDGVDQKIGIECSFSHDQYNLETRWSNFFDYLVKKGVCLPEKRAALLQFPGVEQEDAHYDFNLDSYQIAAKIPENNFSSALVRYISHIKLVYKPNQPLEAKAYPGARLFGHPAVPIDTQYQ